MGRLLRGYLRFAAFWLSGDGIVVSHCEIIAAVKESRDLNELGLYRPLSREVPWTRP